jgi:AraC family transcriptional regulator of adaptative response / DNA-3-methyladenine glycosylase II
VSWATLLKFLGDRTIPGVESVENNRYWRAVKINQSKGPIKGWINVERAPNENTLRVEVSHSLARALPSLLATSTTD